VYLNLVRSGILITMKLVKSKVCAIIVAAGESRRMSGVDKVMALLGRKPALAWSIEAFQQNSKVDRIILVNSQKNTEPVRCLAIEKKWSKVADVCTGGRRRQDSVAAGLALVDDCEWVIIHDGARPLITQDLIERGLAAAKKTGAAAAAVPVTDTIKLVDDNQIVNKTLPRPRLWAVQTPQVFRVDIIKEAYKRIREDVTDDASMVEQIGHKVKLYMGSYDNIKITTPHDLEIADLILKEHGQ
jgi:2-C-methyl-D-erythritol 4-phosphate cytidylyltransferase